MASPVGHNASGYAAAPRVERSTAPPVHGFWCDGGVMLNFLLTLGSLYLKVRNAFAEAGTACDDGHAFCQADGIAEHMVFCQKCGACITLPVRDKGGVGFAQSMTLDSPAVLESECDEDCE